MRFSKDALLKWLRENEVGAEDVRDSHAKSTSKKRQARAEFWDGQAVAFSEVIHAIEHGEIGEGK